MVIDEEVKDFLEHFGTAGMKWGVRNSRTGNHSTNKLARMKRKESKTQTRKDKVFEALDLDRTNPKSKMSNSTKAMIIVGTGLSAAAVILRMHGNRSVNRMPMSKPLADHPLNVSEEAFRSVVRNMRTSVSKSQTLNQTRRNLNDPNYVWKF